MTISCFEKIPLTTITAMFDLAFTKERKGNMG